jgi:hypothetical protein
MLVTLLLYRSRSVICDIVSTFPVTKEQFLDIGVKVCPKLKEETSRIIGEEVWKTSKDVRDVVSLSKLIGKSDGPDEIETIMRTFTKYGGPTRFAE